MSLKYQVKREEMKQTVAGRVHSVGHCHTSVFTRFLCFCSDAQSREEGVSLTAAAPRALLMRLLPDSVRQTHSIRPKTVL